MKSLKKWAQLNPKVVGTATYYDGAILQPERLGVELILDAGRPALLPGEADQLDGLSKSYRGEGAID